MPYFKAQFKEGSKTDSREFEAKSVNDLLTFLEATTTMQVTQILEIHYQANFDKRIDDPSKYYSIFKAWSIGEPQVMNQLIIPHLKKSIISKNVFELAKKHLLVDDKPVTDFNKISLF